MGVIGYEQGINVTFVSAHVGILRRIRKFSEERSKQTVLELPNPGNRSKIVNQCAKTILR